MQYKAEPQPYLIKRKKVSLTKLFKALLRMRSAFLSESCASNASNVSELKNTAFVQIVC
jgi:hypothetical protein